LPIFIAMAHTRFWAGWEFRAVVYHAKAPNLTSTRIKAALSLVVRNYTAISITYEFVVLF
jgi:hypothetical protein